MMLENEERFGEIFNAANEELFFIFWGVWIWKCREKVKPEIIYILIAIEVYAILLQYYAPDSMPEVFKEEEAQPGHERIYQVVILAAFFNHGTFLTTLIMYPLIFYTTLILVLYRMKGAVYDPITGELIEENE